MKRARLTKYARGLHKAPDYSSEVHKIGSIMALSYRLSSHPPKKKHNRTFSTNAVADPGGGGGATGAPPKIGSTMFS